MGKPKMVIRKFHYIVLDWKNTFDPEKNKENKDECEVKQSEVIFKLQICDRVKEWKTIYCGPKTQFKVDNLGACTCNSFRIQKAPDSDWIYFKGATYDIGPYNSVMHMTRAVKLGKTAIIRKIATVTPLLLNAENKENKTPLVQAIDNNDIQIVQLLINLGAKVNQSQRYSKRTPLMITIYQGKLHIASLLIDKGADTSLKDVNGLNILHYAVDSNKIANVEFALQYNVDVNGKDNCGWTPLLRSVILGCTQGIVDILIKHGANKNVLDKFGFDFEKHIKLSLQMDMEEKKCF